MTERLAELVVATGGTRLQADNLVAYLIGHWGHAVHELRDRMLAIHAYIVKYVKNKYPESASMIYELFLTSDEGVRDFISMALRDQDPIHREQPKRAREDDEKEQPAPKRPEPERPDVVLEVIRASRQPLYDYQVRAVRQFHENRKGLGVFYQTGMGKTLVGVVCSVLMRRLVPGIPIIVVATKSLLQNFQQSMEKYGLSRMEAGYAFYTYEKFNTEFIKNPDLTRGAFLIADEAHHSRTEVYANLRVKIRAQVKKLARKTPENLTASERTLMQRTDEIMDALTECKRQEYSFPLRTIRDRFGVNLMSIAPRSAVMIEAAFQAAKVLVMTATPCFNDRDDICNLFSMVTGRGIVNRRYFGRFVTGSDQDFRQAFNKLFVFRDVNPNDPTMPKTEFRRETIQMTPEWYALYHKVELANHKRLDKNPWVFCQGVRQGCNNAEEEQETDNPKCQWVLDHLAAHPGERTIIYSNFVTNGIRIIQHGLRRMGIEFEEITGDTELEDRAGAVEAYNRGAVNILFVTNAGSEGVDLKGTRHAIAYETEWNWSTTMQFFGRGPRKGSHLHLPKEEQQCVFYQLVLVKPPKAERFATDKWKESADEILERITLQKEKEIQPFLRRLKSIQPFPVCA